MGKYKLAEGVDQFKGSLEGSTFQKCGQVFSIRKHNTPVQKRSVKQSASKNRFEHVQTSYRTLDSLEKATFANQTENFTRINSLGNEYTLLPVQLFSSTNNTIVESGQPLLREMSNPVIYPGISEDTVAMDNTLSALDIVINPNLVPSGFTLRVESTRPLSNGVLAVENDFRLLGFIPGGQQSSSMNWYQVYIAIFGTTFGQVGMTIAGRTTLISNDNGQPGQSLIQYGFVEG